MTGSSGVLFADSAFCHEWATTLARILWEPLPDDAFVGLLALVPSPHARLVLTIADTLLSRLPNRETHTPEQSIRLLTGLSIVVVTSLVKELDRRAGDREGVPDRCVRRWIARGEPTLEELKALIRLGQRRRINPHGKDETDSIYRAALAEHTTDALRDHFTAPLDEQFRHMLDGFFGTVAWKADNTVRDALRKEALHQRRELGVDLEQLTDIKGSANHCNEGFCVERTEGADRAILLLEVCACPALTDQERQVTELRLQDLTQGEIARRLRISQPRVSQLERQAIAKMRQHAKPRP